MTTVKSKSTIVTVFAINGVSRIEIGQWIYNGDHIKKMRWIASVDGMDEAAQAGADFLHHETAAISIRGHWGGNHFEIVRYPA